MTSDGTSITKHLVPSGAAKPLLSPTTVSAGTGAPLEASPVTAA